MNWTAIGQFLVELMQALFSRPDEIKQAPMNQEIPPNPDVLAAWDGPTNNHHNVRVLCDLSHLNLTQKNIIAACVMQESAFYNVHADGTPLIHENVVDGVIKSTDYGIVQCNDVAHIGAGKDFASVEYVMENPQKMVQWMIDIFKMTGFDPAKSPWSSYKYGAYKKWLGKV